ncbi:hypothetical protein P5V15_004297 [Pogonomyrmex californicus]
MSHARSRDTKPINAVTRAKDRHIATGTAIQRTENDGNNLNNHPVRKLLDNGHTMTLMQRRDVAPSYVKKFQNTPGVYFKETGSMNQKDNEKLTQLFTRLRTIYYTRDSKRGLINAIGTISKTLFNTMDAEDEEHLNEQIQMLQEG